MGYVKENERPLPYKAGAAGSIACVINERSMDVMAGCRPVACPATVPPQRPTALRPLRGAKPGRSAIAEPGLPHATAGRHAQQPRAISYLVVTGCAFWWCIMVRYRRCTWQFGSPRYDTPSPPQQQSSSLWPALYSFVRLSMSLVFGLKMHLASAIAPRQWTAACPQLHNHDIQPKYPSILVAILAAIYVSKCGASSASMHPCPFANLSTYIGI